MAWKRWARARAIGENRAVLPITRLPQPAKAAVDAAQGAGGHGAHAPRGAAAPAARRTWLVSKACTRLSASTPPATVALVALSTARSAVKEMRAAAPGGASAPGGSVVLEGTTKTLNGRHELGAAAGGGGRGGGARSSARHVAAVVKFCILTTPPVARPHPGRGRWPLRVRHKAVMSAVCLLRLLAMSARLCRAAWRAETCRARARAASEPAWPRHGTPLCGRPPDRKEAGDCLLRGDERRIRRGRGGRGRLRGRGRGAAVSRRRGVRLGLGRR